MSIWFVSNCGEHSMQKLISMLVHLGICYHVHGRELQLTLSIAIYFTSQVFEDLNLTEVDVRYFDSEWDTWIDVTDDFTLQKKEKFIVGMLKMPTI